MPWRGVHLPGAVIYELHVGAFATEGTLDAAITRLDHLVELGVDIVEVMPLATFPGRHGWGYDGVGLYAVHQPYGGPLAFRRFVDACHAVNLASDVTIIDLDPDPAGDPMTVVLAWDPASTTIDGTRLILPAESPAVLGPVRRQSEPT